MLVTVTSTREIVNAADGVTVVVSLLSNGKTSVRLRDDDSGNLLDRAVAACQDRWQELQGIEHDARFAQLAGV